MKEIKVQATIRQEVSVNPLDAFEAIKTALGFSCSRPDYLCVKDGELVRGEDVSYHGSPLYEYKTVSNNPKWIELFNSMKIIEDYFKNCEQPEWMKIIEEPEQSEEEAHMMKL